MVLDRQPDKPVQQLRIRYARGLPEFWIHADRGETGDRVQFVEIDGIGLLPYQKVDSRHSGAVQDPETLRGVGLNFLLHGLWQPGGNHGS